MVVPPAVVAPPAAVAPQAVTPQQPAGGIAPAADESTPTEPTPAQQKVLPEVNEKTLPFTGRDLVLMALGGISLIGLGLALRKAVARRGPAGC